jgi:uncharacterized protein
VQNVTWVCGFDKNVGGSRVCPSKFAVWQVIALPKTHRRLTIARDAFGEIGLMHAFGNGPNLPKEFAGEVRLFPLPNLVMFPNVLQALHIFETRYCQMLAEAMATDKLIAMALLQPGWEKNYQDNPAIAPVVCIGKVVSHTETPDGTFNILLVGVKRAKIIREIETQLGFRKAHVEIIEDINPADHVEEALRQKLMQAVNICVSDDSSFNLEKIESLASQIPLGALVDLISYGYPFSAHVKQMLLEETQTDRRCELLLQELQDQHDDAEKLDLSTVKPSRRDFPPSFSDN